MAIMMLICCLTRGSVEGDPGGHHTCPLNMGKGGRGDRCRAVLNQAGLPIEHAANGVWLPTVDVGSAALLHKGIVHNNDALNKVADRLQAVLNNARNRGLSTKEEVCKELVKIAKEMATGEFKF